MDIETLKLVLETVENVSGDAVWIAVLFSAKGYFIAILWAVVVLYFFKKLFSFLVPICQNINIATRIRNRLGIHGGYCTDSEIKKVMDIVEKVAETKHGESPFNNTQQPQECNAVSK